MSIRDAIYRALTGRSREEEPTDLRGRMAEMERIHGSKRAAAEAAGVSKSTWWRWGSGRQRPKPASSQRVERAHRRSLVPESRRREVLASTMRGAGSGGITISGYDTYDGRSRTLYVGRHVDEGRASALLAAYEAGADPTDQMRELLQEAGYPPHLVETITDPVVDFRPAEP